MTYVKPPINEVGLSISFPAPTLFDLYDFRSIHELFATDYPEIERAEPTVGNDTEVSVGMPALSLQAATRWWLVSADSSNVLQLQENYFSRNWRRTAGMDERPHYPGFDPMLSDFERDLSKLRAFRSAQGHELPAPRSVELLYDNIIPAGLEDEQFRLSKILNFWKPLSQNRRKTGWQCAWLEPFPILGTDTDANLSVQFLAAGLPQQDAPPRTVLRAIWKASALGMPLDEVGSFFRAAHDHITERFNEVLTPEIRSAWS